MKSGKHYAKSANILQKHTENVSPGGTILPKHPQLACQRHKATVHGGLWGRGNTGWPRFSPMASPPSHFWQLYLR